MFLQEALDRRDVFPGGILVPQTFGGMANWNPHVHALITDTCWDREGNQYAMPEITTADLKVIEELFSAIVFRILLEEGMISEELVENMNSWKHSGFSVHSGSPVKAEDEDPRPPPVPLELVCEPCADYVPWKYDVPEIEVG